MDSAARSNQPMYSGRTPRRGSISSGSAHRGEDGSGMGNGYQTNLRSGNGDNHNHNELQKTIYVSNITVAMPDDALWEAFGQFGRVESLVRRDVNVDMNNNTEQQYAFIRFRNRQDARYAITTGEVNFYGRKLVIRPRDKPSYMKQNVNGNMHDRARDFEGYEKGRPRSFQGTDRRFEHRGSLVDLSLGFPMSPGHMQTPPVAPPAELLSKVLTVANLPADMSPKELYELFASYGSVERSYIYPQADALGRRFGDVTMASFFFAQKAFEGLNCFAIRGVPLDVSYKANPQAMATVSSDPLAMARIHAWAIPQQMQWPYHLYSGNGPTIPSGHAGVQYNQQNPGIVLPYAVWNAPNNGNTAAPSYGYPGVPIQGVPAPAHIPVCVYPPQHGNGGQFQRNHSASNSYPSNGQGNSSGDTTDALPLPDSASRSVSGASSTTLVASNDSGSEKKYRSPVIVTSPTYSDHSIRMKNAASPGGTILEKAPPGTFPAQDTETANCESLEQLVVTDVPSLQYEAVHTQVPTSLTTGAVKTFDPTKPAFVPETSKPRDPSNLYIKNLDDLYISSTMDLKLTFGQYGQIASAYLATYPNGTSKGFGFVAFVNAADAVTAKEQLDGLILGRKRVFVTFAERKEERTQRLRELFENKKDSDSNDVLQSSAPEADRAGDSSISDRIKATSSLSRETTAHAVDSMEPSCRDSMDLGGTSQNEGEVTVTTTVTTTKAWKGTQLQGIVEVEEEESPCTKKFRQQRTQDFVQQTQMGGLGYKDPRTVPFTNTPTSPSSTKSVPDYHSAALTGGRTELCTGSPIPVQQRPRQNGVQSQRRSQSPRNGVRPFYPPGRSDSTSPKSPMRPTYTSSLTPVPGAPTGPRAQFSNNRNASVGTREPNPKKKKAVRRNNNTSNGPTASDHINGDRRHREEGRPSYNGLRNGVPGSQALDTRNVANQLENLEIRSAP